MKEDEFMDLMPSKESLIVYINKGEKKQTVEPKISVNYQDDKDKVRSALNKDIFCKGKEIMEDKIQSPFGGEYIGWCGLSAFVDYIEENYNISEKVVWQDYDKENNFPKNYKPVWVETFQDHVNLAWYVNGRFWPYGGSISDGRLPFGDKFGACDVCYWKYSELPDIASPR